jgi:hypothetical protein
MNTCNESIYRRFLNLGTRYVIEPYVSAPFAVRKFYPLLWLEDMMKEEQNILLLPGI